MKYYFHYNYTSRCVQCTHFTHGFKTHQISKELDNLPNYKILICYSEIKNKTSEKSKYSPVAVQSRYREDIDVIYHV